MAREILVIAAGRGRLPALEQVLRALPEDFPVPVVVAYQREPASEPVRAMLHAKVPLPVREVEDKDELAPGAIHLAPHDYHLLVEDSGLALSTEAPVHEARPSADALLESAADAFKARVTAVLLQGPTPDGDRGVVAVKRRGGHAIVESGVACATPAEIDQVLPAAEIGPSLVARLHGSGARSALAGGVA